MEEIQRPSSPNFTLKSNVQEPIKRLTHRVKVNNTMYNLLKIDSIK